MTNSRSRASRSSVLAALVVCCAILGAGGMASAERKRVVVLEFEGPKGAKFHDDLVRLLKRTHTVVPTDKWNGTAEELDASTASDKNFKKVARKLKIDAIVEGTIEKRRDAYIIRLKLHEGKTGALVGGAIDTKAGGPRIDSRAQRDLKNELIDVIGKVEANRPSSTDDEDDDDRPAKQAAKATDDDDGKPATKAARKADDDDRPEAKKAAKTTDDDELPAKKARKGFSKHADDDHGTERLDKKAAKPAEDDDALPAKKAAKKPDDDALPPKKPTKPAEDDDALPAKKAVAKKTDDDALPAKRQKTDDDDRRAKKKVASRGDDDAGVEADAGEPVNAAANQSPGERALDVVAGMSVTARQLTFKTRTGLADTPPAYKGAPVAGAMLDATIYPLAIGHKRASMLNNFGLEVMYDRVISVNTKDPAGKLYGSKETRFGIAGVFRYPFGHGATSPVIMATFGYSSQLFSIDSGALIGIPSVKYTILEPGAGLRLPVISRLILGVDAKLMAISDTGQIGDAMQYGAASVLGFEGAAGLDYMITRSVLVRAAFRYETIGYTFKFTGALTTGRDGDPTSRDIPGARDSYIGGMATVGYVY
jgi:opacity protein-like surface antigen